MISKLNLASNDNQGFQNRFNHTAASAEFTEVLCLGANGNEQIIAFYSGTDAITEADFVDYPLNTIVFDFQANKWGIKNAARGSTSFLWSSAVT